MHVIYHLSPPIHSYPLQMVVHAMLKGLDQPNLLPPLLYIMFYMFLAFPLTFFILIPLPLHLIVLPFSTISIMSFTTFVSIRGLDWGMRMFMRSMSSCRTPLPLGCLLCFLTLLLLLLFCGIVDLAILIFLNLSKPYHGYLLLSLCVSRVKWANIII